MFGLPFIGTLPDQNLPPAKIIEKYGSIKEAYKLAGQYYSMAYNRTGVRRPNESTVDYATSEFSEILENWDMFHGLQNTRIFKYLDQVLDGDTITDMPIPVQPGQEIGTIILFLQGLFLGVAGGAEPTVKVINDDIKNKATQKFKMIEMKRLFGDYIKAIEEAANGEFAIPADPTAGKEKIVRAVFNSFATGLQLHAGKLCDYIRENSATLGDMLRSYTNHLCARHAVLHVNESGMIDVINGEHYAKIASRDHDFGRYDQARMFVTSMHRDEVIANNREWLTKDEIDQIRSGAFAQTEIFSQYANYYGYDLYLPNTEMMTGVTVYYKSVIDSGYVQKKDLEGNPYIKAISSKQREKGRKGIELLVIRKVTIWSNTFATNYGIAKVVEDPSQLGNKIFPILEFSANTFRGKNVCLMDRAKWKQQQLDAIDNRITEMYTMDLGTIIALNGAKFDNGITPERAYGILRKNRTIVTKKNAYAEDPTNREPMIQREDLSLMRDITQYINIKKDFREELRDIANVNNVVMGTPKSYVGLKTQQNSSALASNSLQYGIYGVMQLWADAMAIAVEMVRQRVINDPENPLFVNLLGDEGIQMILDTKDVPFNRWHLTIDHDDAIDPQLRERIMGLMTMFAGSKEISMRDVLEVFTAKTLSQLKDYAAYAQEKTQMMQMIDKAEAIQANTQNAQTIAQGNVQGRQVEAETRDITNKRDNVTKLADTALKQTGDPEAAAAIMQGAK